MPCLLLFYVCCMIVCGSMCSCEKIERYGKGKRGVAERMKHYIDIAVTLRQGATRRQ